MAIIDTVPSACAAFDLADCGLPGPLWKSSELLASGPYSQVFRLRPSGSGEGVVVKICHDERDQYAGDQRLFDHREALVYQILADAVAPVPVPCLIGSGSVLEANTTGFLILAEVPGALYSTARVTMPSARRLDVCRSLGQILAAVHALPVDSRLAAGSPDSLNAASWFQRFTAVLDIAVSQLEAEQPRYKRLWSRCRSLAAQTSRSPIGVPLSLVHGDLTAGNVIVDDKANVAAVIDWEWSAVADPALDAAKIEFEARFGSPNRLYVCSEERRAFWRGYMATAPKKSLLSLQERYRVYALFYVVAPLIGMLHSARSQLEPHLLLETADQMIGMIECWEWEGQA